MPAKPPENTRPSNPCCALTVVLYPTTGRASVIDDPRTSPEIAEILERMARDGIKRMSSSR
jgi:hypothetical protein